MSTEPKPFTTDLLTDPTALAVWQAQTVEAHRAGIKGMNAKYGFSMTAIAVGSDGKVFDYMFNVETGISYANNGWLVVALADDDGCTAEQAQRAYDRELSTALDCFGIEHLCHDA